MRQIPESASIADRSFSAYQFSADAVVDHLESSRQTGLTADRVALLQEQFGSNQLTARLPVPGWKKFLLQFREIVIWILIVAAVIAGLMGEWIDCIAIMSIVMLNGLLGFIQEEKASRALSALRAMSSPVAKVVRDGSLQTVAARFLVPGDLIQMEAGDNVPADARLIEAWSLSTQEASLTGESTPVDKDASRILAANTPIADQVNSMFLGTVVSAGKATAIVCQTGMNTQLGKIAGMLDRTDNQPTPLQRRLAELGKILVVVCVVMVGVIFTAHYLRGNDFLETLMVSVSLAVAAVPEGLPAVVTITLALGMQRMVKRNALIRRLPSVETLGSVTVICSDKTGTLTRNEITAREVRVGSGWCAVTGSGYEPKGEFLQVNPDEVACPAETRDREPGEISRSDSVINPRDFSDLTMVLTIAANCNNADVVSKDSGSSWQVTGDPTEAALLVLAMKAGVDINRAQRQVLFEIPFDSERKAMSVVVQESPGTVMYTKGATEVVLEWCNREMSGSQVIPLSAERKQQIHDQASGMAGRALRVLAFAWHDQPKSTAGQYRESGLIFAGIAGMMDPPREEAKKAVAECFAAGIQPQMITGDHPDTALAIGRELNLATPHDRAVTGSELDGMSDEELVERVIQIPIYARVSASHKMRVIRAWKQRGQVVAMTGDGVNDAPAVQAADIGIAMGITGTDVTREAADIVLTDDNFASIVSAVREGRGIFDNIRKIVHYLLSCNAGEVMLMFAATILGLPLPLAAIQILWINLVTDGLPALALAREPPERGIMSRAPRPPRQPVITWQGGLLILYHGLLMTVVSLAGFWWIYRGDPENLNQARTACFAIAAFSQLAFALACRSHRFTLPQLGLASNPWLFWAIAGSGLLQVLVLNIPVSRELLHTVPLSGNVWLLVVGVALVPTTIIETAKILTSRWIGDPGSNDRRSKIR